MTQNVVAGIDFTVEAGRTSFNFYVSLRGDVTRLLTIHSDGRIERGAAFETEDQASLAFWSLLENAYPIFFGRSLVNRLKEFLAGDFSDWLPVKSEYQNGGWSRRNLEALIRDLESAGMI